MAALVEILASHNPDGEDFWNNVAGNIYTWNVTAPSEGIPEGDTLVLMTAGVNPGTTAYAFEYGLVPAGAIGCTDSMGNTYASDATIQDSAHPSVYFSAVSAAMSAPVAGSSTMTFSIDTSPGAAPFFFLLHAAGNVSPVVNQTSVDTTSDTSESLSTTNSNPVDPGSLVLGVTGFTDSTDVTDAGPWTEVDTFAASTNNYGGGGDVITNPDLWIGYQLDAGSPETLAATGDGPGFAAILKYGVLTAPPAPVPLPNISVGPATSGVVWMGD